MRRIARGYAGPQRGRQGDRRDVATATAGAFRGVPRRRRGSSRGIRLLRNPTWRAREPGQLRPRQRAPLGVCPAAGGDQAAGFRSCGIPLADQRKCTESVSPPSNSPDRPSPKRLPGGRAFNLGRSVLGALGNLLAHLAGVKHSLERMCRKLRQSSFPSHSVEKFGPRKSAPRSGAPSSGLPTDRRRSDCLSEGHQPQALLPRCTRDTTVLPARRQVGSDRETRTLRPFLFAQQ